jgi:hypothetical protein
LGKDELWLARPDGHVACAAKVGDEEAIERYLADHL